MKLNLHFVQHVKNPMFFQKVNFKSISNLTFFLVDGVLKPYTHTCPLCNFQVVSVLNESKNTTYYICPCCANNPPKQNDVSKRFLLILK